MRIGIFTFRQYPYVSANVSIGYTVASALKKKHHAEIILIGVKQDKNQDQIKEYEGMPIRFLNTTIKKENRLKNKLKFVMGEKYFWMKEAKNLKNLVQMEKIDALICVIAPIQVSYITQAAKLNIPCYLYQLDPYYNVGDMENIKLKKEFIHLISNVEHVFTTDLLYDLYMKDNSINKYKNKFSILRFPKLQLQKENSGEKQKETKKVTLVYAGSLYKQIRSPNILIQLKKSIPNNCNIIFLGSCDDENQEKELMKSGVDCLGYCSSAKVEQQLAKADFLINIGNTVKNQLGSKLIEYIATGKPIINIYQHNECPTIKVLERYSYKINLSTDELKNAYCKDKLFQFITKTVGKKEEFKGVREKYYEYTPEYVSKEIANKIGMGV